MRVGVGGLYLVLTRSQRGYYLCATPPKGITSIPPCKKSAQKFAYMQFL